ncbi:MAG: hypothetical protein AAF462_06720 [Thermodesulfobacteriota bacterium]
MEKDSINQRYSDLIEESKAYTHGFWKPEDFKTWGKKALDILDELCGINSKYYTTFLRTHHEALVLGTDDSRFNTYVSVCITILRSAFNEFEHKS